jgi:hypothetical protein
VKDKQSFLNLKVEQYEVGKYIYDAILANNRMVSIENINLNLLKKILLEVIYFFYFKDLIKSKNIKIIVLGDNVYRYGLLFELAKYNNIECITPVNLNAFSMRKYNKSSEFNIHDRKPEKKYIRKIR